MRKNLALRMVLALMAFGLLLSAPNAALAIPFSAEALTTDNRAKVTIKPIVSYGWVHTEYTLRTDLFGDLDAFCVQNVFASSGTEQYELVPVPDQLARAAWIAEHYWNGVGLLGSKEDYQIAIWEIVFDGGNINLSKGNFRYHSGASSKKINKILNLQWGTPSDMVSLAHNPVGDWHNPGYQDFLVRYPFQQTEPVSEPATMLLLGVGLIGLAGIGRKMVRG